MVITKLTELDENTKELDLSGQSIGSSEWPLLKKGVSLEKLDLSDSNLTDDQAPIIGTLTNLRELDVSNTELTKVDFLSGDSGLEVLHINCTDVSGFPVPLSKLKKLHANLTKITDLKQLYNTPNLEVIDLEDNDFDDLRPLEKLLGLTYLNLYGCSKVFDINPVTKLERLEELHLKNTCVDALDCLVSNLKNISMLKELTVNEDLEQDAEYILQEIRKNCSPKTPLGLFFATKQIHNGDAYSSALPESSSTQKGKYSPDYVDILGDDVDSDSESDEGLSYGAEAKRQKLYDSDSEQTPPASASCAFSLPLIRGPSDG